jgi:hypothetical protein
VSSPHVIRCPKCFERDRIREPAFQPNVKNMVLYECENCGFEWFSLWFARRFRDIDFVKMKKIL